MHPEGYEPLSELWPPDLFLFGTHRELQEARTALQGHKRQYRRLVLVCLDEKKKGSTAAGVELELSAALQCGVKHGSQYDTALPAGELDTRLQNVTGAIAALQAVLVKETRAGEEEKEKRWTYLPDPVPDLLDR